MPKYWWAKKIGWFCLKTVILKYQRIKFGSFAMAKVGYLHVSSTCSICINLLQRYIYPQFMPPSAIHGKFNKNRTLRLRRARGRLELTDPPYIESSCLQASDAPTKRLAIQQQACSWLVVVQKLHRIFWPHILHIFIDNPLPYRTELLQTSLQAAWDGDRQFCHCYFLHALHSEERGRINESDYHYSIITPPIFVAKSNWQKGGGHNVEWVIAEMDLITWLSTAMKRT